MIQNYEKNVKEEKKHERYMSRCLDLALLGLGSTVPNPMVGSVIVHQDCIIGEGYHREYGGPHAEVNAVNAVAEKSLLADSVLYVNLEPCSHTGKTPPCADMIIRCSIHQVVIGTSDPNPLVAGRGIEKLTKAGISVISNIIPEKCQYLNRRFIVFHTRERPFVVLKWAQTQDGFMDILRENREIAEPNWISNEISRMIVHEWRSEEQAILVGTNTAFLDNPRLNVREWPGRSPVRMVIDRMLRLPPNLYIFDNSCKTLIFNSLKDGQDRENHYIQLDFGKDIIPQLLNKLYKLGIQSVMVEGGRKLLDSFLETGFWDEARVFTGQKSFGSGISAPVIRGIDPEEHRIREDRLWIYRRKHE
jgi:diaminohydroxyphosphoribosylaminopyrimidine deaminase/5-amino-6-(5-phosphoribosylamino)uracil reductase